MTDASSWAIIAGAGVVLLGLGSVAHWDIRTRLDTIERDWAAKLCAHASALETQFERIESMLARLDERQAELEARARQLWRRRNEFHVRVGERLVIEKGADGPPTGV